MAGGARVHPHPLFPLRPRPTDSRGIVMQAARSRAARERSRIARSPEICSFAVCARPSGGPCARPRFKVRGDWNLISGQIRIRSDCRARAAYGRGTGGYRAPNEKGRRGSPAEKSRPPPPSIPTKIDASIDYSGSHPLSPVRWRLWTRLSSHNGRLGWICDRPVFDGGRCPAKRPARWRSEFSK